MLGRHHIRAISAAVLGLAVMIGPFGPIKAQSIGTFEDGLRAYDRKDYLKALQIWLPLAQNNDLAAQRNIAHIFRYGLGVEKDPKEAFEWYLEAADRGLSRAQANVADMYLKGEGVNKDSYKAAVYFNRAAVAGHVIAQHYMGLLYESGRGVPKNQALAMGWYNLAGKAGYKPSLDRLSAIALGAPMPDEADFFRMQLDQPLPDTTPLKPPSAASVGQGTVHSATEKSSVLEGQPSTNTQQSPVFAQPEDQLPAPAAPLPTLVIPAAKQNAAPQQEAFPSPTFPAPTASPAPSEVVPPSSNVTTSPSAPSVGTAAPEAVSPTAGTQPAERETAAQKLFGAIGGIFSSDSDDAPADQPNHQTSDQPSKSPTPAQVTPEQSGVGNVP